MIGLLPKTQVVLELEEAAADDNQVLERCLALRQQGFRIAVEGVTELSPRLQKLMAMVDVIKVDINGVKDLPALAQALRNSSCLKVAAKVETQDLADQCMKLGFDLFQGYYFAHPEILSGKRADPARLALLKILSLLNTEAEVHELEEEFKHHPKLAYNLMRLVNSAASGLPRKIESVRQGIVVLGRQTLARWVQLLLYASQEGAESSPLLLTAATRAKTMEGISQVMHPNYRDYADRAFMVGLMSLLDALLQMEMQAVLAELALADDVKTALLKREGPLGQMLSLLEAKEKNDIDAVIKLLKQNSPLALSQLVNFELKAAAWANAINAPAEAA